MYHIPCIVNDTSSNGKIDGDVKMQEELPLCCLLIDWQWVLRTYSSVETVAAKHARLPRVVPQSKMPDGLSESRRRHPPQLSEPNQLTLTHDPSRHLSVLSLRPLFSTLPNPTPSRLTPVGCARRHRRPLIALPLDFSPTSHSLPRHIHLKHESQRNLQSPPPKMGLSREARIITLLVIDSAFFFLEIIVGEQRARATIAADHTS